MKRRTYAMKDAERLLPLLRAIRRELRERVYEATRLETLQDALLPSRKVHGGDLALVEAELSAHRRELRRAERELADLGCRVDQDRPLRILVPSDRGELAVDGELFKTTLRRVPQRQGA